MIVNTRYHPIGPINRKIHPLASVLATPSISRYRRYPIQPVAHRAIAVMPNKLHVRPRAHHRIHQAQPWPQLSVNLQ